MSVGSRALVPQLRGTARVLQYLAGSDDLASVSPGGTGKLGQRPRGSWRGGGGWRFLKRPVSAGLPPGHMGPGEALPSSFPCGSCDVQVLPGGKKGSALELGEEGNERALCR